VVVNCLIEKICLQTVLSSCLKYCSFDVLPSALVHSSAVEP